MESPAGIATGRCDASADGSPPWVSLFNSERFHALNLGPGQRSLRLDAHDPEGRLIGALSGVLEGSTFTSGFSAPFGGIDLARERETPANVAQVVEHALDRLQHEGVTNVVIKLPPAAYGESEPLIQFTLLNSGFSVARCELNQHIDVTADYLDRLKSPARRALRRALAEPFSFAPARAEADWERAYATLAANRAQKGRSLSLSRDYVARARDELGDRVAMYELFHDNAACAAALVYRARPQRDLVVAWGDADHGLERSPMNLLALRVVEAALAAGTRTLDLAVSNEHGPDGALVPNPGLVQFKQSVNAQITPRLTLVKELTS